MVTRDEVVAAYRLILGREPESEIAVDYHARTAADLGQLRRTLLDSDEFQARLPASASSNVGRHYAGRPIAVQLDGPADQSKAMFDRIAKVWNDLGESEPHWSVLSDPQFYAANIAATEAAFYASGFGARDTLLAFFARNGIAPDPSLTVLELGCGVGRISHALAASFAHVTGVDISQAHLALAARHCAGNGIANVEFRRLSDVASIASLPSADILFSLIVLQHNPPPVMHALLDALLSKVNPGGYAFFQVPTYARGYRFAWDDYLAGGPEGIEMHVLPQKAVHVLLVENGFVPIEVQEDAWVGIPAFVSHTFFAQRRPSGGFRGGR